MNNRCIKRLLAFTILLGFTVLSTGCISIPLFKNALTPVSDKAAKDLVKSSWICRDDGDRMILSFVKKGDGNYVTIFRKSEFVEGKLKQENFLLPGRVCRAGKKRFLFFEAIDPEKSTDVDKSTDFDKKVTKEDAGYMVFYFEISGDELSLYLLKSNTFADLVEAGTLKGSVTRSRWSKDVVIETESELLEEVLSTIDLSELIGKESGSRKAKTFKRKN